MRLGVQNEEHFDTDCRERFLGDESWIMPYLPSQLQFDFRFSRVLNEHLEQISRTKFFMTLLA